MKKSLFLSVILAAVVSGAGAMNLSDSPVSPVKDESVGLVFSRMFNSTRDGLSWAGSKLAGLFARSQQVQQEGCGDLFGGACSSGELQSRIDMNFDRSIFSPLVDSFKGLVGSGVDSRESTGSLDTKLREVEASKVVTQSQIDELRDNRDISDAAKSYALEQCYRGFKGDLGVARQIVSVNAGEIDRISLLPSDAPTSSRDLGIAKTVNNAIIDPYQRLKRCLGGIVTGDHLVRPQVNLGQDLVRGKADPYIGSNRIIEMKSDMIDRQLVQARAELKRKEIAERCQLSGSSLACLVDSAKLAASDTRDWLADGWRSLETQSGHIAHQIGAVDYAGKWEIARDWGVSSDYDPYTNYAIQGGKMAGGAALAAVGIYAAYKLGKLSWRAACALKRALWDGRSKWTKIALAVGLTAAVAAAPSSADLISNYYGL